MNSLSIWLLSAIWSNVNWIMRLALKLKILRSEKLDSYVVSIGNIQAGGAGKTPIVAFIANHAAKKGGSVCILCRGYGAEWEKVRRWWGGGGAGVEAVVVRRRRWW
jgi:tetraacyldisaccharide 4'-kinase